MRRVVLPLLFVVLCLSLPGLCRGGEAALAVAPDGGASASAGAPPENVETRLDATNGTLKNIPATNKTMPKSLPEEKAEKMLLIRHVQTYDLPDPVFVFELRAFNEFWQPHLETNIGDGVLEGVAGGSSATFISSIEIRCRKSAGQDCSPKSIVIRKATADWVGEPPRDLSWEVEREPVDISSYLGTDPRESRPFAIFKKGPLPPAVAGATPKNAGKGRLAKNKQQILVYYESLNDPRQNDCQVRLTFPPGQAKRYKKIFLLSSEGPSIRYNAGFDKKQPSVWKAWLDWNYAGSSYGGHEITLYKVNGVFYNAGDGSIAYGEEKVAPFPWITLYQVTGWTKDGRKVDLLPFLAKDPFTPLPLELEGKGPLPNITEGF